MVQSCVRHAGAGDSDERRCSAMRVRTAGSKGLLHINETENLLSVHASAFYCRWGGSVQ